MIYNIPLATQVGMDGLSRSVGLFGNKCGLISEAKIRKMLPEDHPGSVSSLYFHKNNICSPMIICNGHLLIYFIALTRQCHVAK